MLAQRTTDDLRQESNETRHSRHSPQIASPGHVYPLQFLTLTRARNDGFMAAGGRFVQSAQSRCELRAITLGDVVTKTKVRNEPPLFPMAIGLCALYG